mgnify:CR=1 FL=1
MPPSHGVGVDAPAGQKWPRVHVAQRVAPHSGWYSPAAHASHVALAPLAANAPGESYFGAAAALWREGGAARLYRGCLLYNLKAAPSAAVQFATYNGLKSLLPLLADGPAPKHAPKPVARAPAASAGAGAGVSDAVLVAEGPAGAPKRMQLARDASVVVDVALPAGGITFFVVTQA